MTVGFLMKQPPYIDMRFPYCIILVR